PPLTSRIISKKPGPRAAVPERSRREPRGNSHNHKPQRRRNRRPLRQPSTQPSPRNGKRNRLRQNHQRQTKMKLKKFYRSQTNSMYLSVPIFLRDVSKVQFKVPECFLLPVEQEKKYRRPQLITS